MPKVANVFDVLTWYCSFTSTSFSFLRLNLSVSSFCAVHFLIDSLCLIFQPPDTGQYQSAPLKDQYDCVFSSQKKSTCIYEYLDMETLYSWQLDFWMLEVCYSNSIVINNLMSTLIPEISLHHGILHCPSQELLRQVETMEKINTIFITERYPVTNETSSTSRNSLNQSK